MQALDINHPSVWYTLLVAEPVTSPALLFIPLYFGYWKVRITRDVTITGLGCELGNQSP